MSAKLKSKTHLQNTFFDFLSRFLRIWFQSLQKVLVWPQKFFLAKIQKIYKKNAKFHADFESVEKVVKNAPKKWQAKQVWRTWVKVKKCIFCHVFANNFCWVDFKKKIFNGFEISVKFCVFWYPYSIFCSNWHFLYTLIANAQETAQKNGKSFFMNVS